MAAVTSDFINVDLEIASRSKLDALIAEWGERIFVMYHGPGSLPGGPALDSKRHLLTLEAGYQYRSPDAAIHALCALAEGLSPANRRRWDRARKHFDVGYRHRATEFSVNFVLRPDTLARLVALGATLAVSVYQAERKRVRAKPSQPLAA